MKPIELALETTNGFINSFTRNTVEGWWELEIGLAKAWVFDENSKIGCEIILENDMGKLIKVFPKQYGVFIDDLIDFVEIIIKTNEVIALKEKEFKDIMNEMKESLEEKAKTYYKELDELRENSFKKNNDNFTKTLGGTKSVKPKSVKPKSERKPRAPRKTTPKVDDKTIELATSVTIKNSINTVTEDTEIIESSKE